MAAAEIINEFEKVRDHEEEKYLAEPSNINQESYEIPKLVEMPIDPETISNESCNEDSKNKDIPPNTVVEKTSSNGEKSSQSNEDEWLDIMGSGNFKKKVNIYFFETNLS